MKNYSSSLFSAFKSAHWFINDYSKFVPVSWIFTDRYETIHSYEFVENGDSFFETERESGSEENENVKAKKIILP